MKHYPAVALTVNFYLFFFGHGNAHSNNTHNKQKHEQTLKLQRRGRVFPCPPAEETSQTDGTNPQGRQERGDVLFHLKRHLPSQEELGVAADVDGLNLN